MTGIIKLDDFPALKRAGYEFFLIWAEFTDRKIEDEEKIFIKTSDGEFMMTYGSFKSHCTDSGS